MLAGLLDAGRIAAQSARWAGIVPGLSLAGVALLVMLSPAPASRRARVLWAVLAGATIAGIGLIGPLAGESGAARWLLAMLWIAALAHALSSGSPGVASLARGWALGAGMSALAGLAAAQGGAAGPSQLLDVGMVLLGARFVLMPAGAPRLIFSSLLAGLGWMGLVGLALRLPWLSRGGVGPVPMALSAAIAFVLLAVAALAAAALVNRRAGAWTLVWALGLLVAMLGLLSVTGLVLGMRTMDVLGGYDQVSWPTALGLIVLGLGLVAACPRSPWESNYRTYLFPAGMGLGLVLLAVMLWIALVRQQQAVEQREQTSRQDSVLTALRGGMDAQVMAIRRMAWRLASVDEATQRQLFTVDAAQYLDDLPGLRAVGYADRGHVLRMIQSRGGLPALPALPDGQMDDVPARRRVFDAVDAIGDVRLSGPTPLRRDGTGALIVSPVHAATGSRGYVVGVVVYDHLFPALLAAQRDVGQVRVLEDGHTLYASGAVTAAAPAFAPTASRSLPMYGRTWQVELGRRSGSPPAYASLVLLLGFALGGLLAVALRLSALARERARQAEAVSGELRDQIEAREVVQAALVDAERDMIAVLESISDGVFMVDREWRFTYVNPQAARMFGATASSLLGLRCWDVLPDVLDEGGPQGHLRRMWVRALRDGTPLSIEAAHGSSQRWYELRAYPHAHGLTVYLHDVSSRKRQERELLKRDAESRHALQLGRMGSWELDLRSGRLHWSAETCAIFGVERSPEEEGMEALRRLVHPDDWASLMEDQDVLRRGEGVVDRRYRMIRPDGELRVIRALAERVDKDGDPVVAGAVQDITEQQRASEDLSRAMEATQLVMDSAPDVIIVLDREGRFLRVSAAARRLWGYAPEELIGESMGSLIHPDDRASSFAEVVRIASGHPNANFRNRNVTRDGRVLHMQWSGVWSAQAQCLYVVGRDHTEMHRAEQMDAAQRRILTAIASGQPLADVLEAIVLAYEAQWPDALCSVLLLREGCLHHGAAPHLPRLYMQAIDGSRIGPEAGSCGTAAWRGERVIVADIATDPLWQDYASLALPHGLQACWSTPIVARDGVVLGTFAVYHGEPHEPSAAELDSIDGLTALAAIAIEHEHAFRQLSASEQRFRSLFEHHPDAVFALDGEGRVRQANAAAAALLGLSPDALRQRPLRHFLHGDRDRLDAALAAAAAGDAERLDVSVHDGAGGHFPAALITLPIMVQGQAHGMFAVLQDRRELRRAQQATASQLALLAAVADSVGEGLLAVNVDGAPTFLNRTAARWLELPAYGLPQAHALPAEARDALAGILAGSGYASSDDARFSLGEGRALDVSYVATPLRIDGRLSGAVLAFRDIGDIKQTRRTLHERQRFFELSLEVFCILDAASGHFVQVNQAFCRLLGYEEETIRAMPLFALIHPQDRLATEDAVHWQQESGELLTGFVNRLRRADGSDVWLEWTSRLSPEGLIFAVARDVTAKRRADAALARAMDDLRIRNRELQDFAYVASHDLQEPLRKIQTFSDRLQSRLADTLDESARDYLQRMGDAASRMQTLIDDLLAYSRVGTRTGMPVAVDLSAELATVLDDLDARVQEAAATVEVEPLPTIHADASQMRQLLQNLLANALKFRAADRPCHIRVTAHPLGEHEHMPERWEIRVEDNGIGFDPTYAERIFAPFQRLHPRNVYAGTGIGLAIVRRIVERHGGSIHAESRSGEGARFIVILPVQASATLTRMAEDAPLVNTDSSGAGT
ncbi:PAS domain S-box protein [Dyella sp. KRB-257]|uniref:PAS domain S-box protein n=1 Tax=Dyella sp. KRB-257 TaxID=3400915 RepID=UPI003BFCC25B